MIASAHEALPIALGQFQTLFNLSALEFPINALKGTGAIGLVRKLDKK